MQKHQLNIALMAGLAAVANSLAQQQSSIIGQGGSKQKRRKDGAIVTDKSGYTTFHGTAPDGGEVNSWAGKFLPAKGGLPDAIKFIDGTGRVQGIKTLQEVREMAVAAEQGLKMFGQQDASAIGQQ